MIASIMGGYKGKSGIGLFETILMEYGQGAPPSPQEQVKQKWGLCSLSTSKSSLNILNVVYFKRVE